MGNELLNNDSYQERIVQLTKDDWKPLLNLIPEIKSTPKFIELNEENLKKGIIELDLSHREARIVHRFREIVYEIPIIIDFDWIGWDKGKEIVGDDNFNYDSIDIPTKCKIITAIVRNDRFCSGRLAQAFESGLILSILESIKNQINFANKENQDK